MRRRARHRSEGQGIARTSLEINISNYVHLVDENPIATLGGEIKPALAQRRFAAKEGWRLGGWNGRCESIIHPVLYFLETYYHPRFRYFEAGPISF